MFKLLVLIMIVASIAGGGYFLYQQKSGSYQNASETISYSPQPETTQDLCETITKGNENVPPIYQNNITWQEPKMIKQTVEYSKKPSLGQDFTSKEMEGCQIKASTDPTYANNLRNYYFSELQNSNWQQVSAADGPNGFSDVYRKNESFFSLRFLNQDLELFIADDPLR